MTQILSTNEFTVAEPRTITSYVAYAVYADYDANAPDTEELAHFSSEDAAQEAADLGNDESDWVVVSEDGKESTEDSVTGRAYKIPLSAFCDGFEWCKRYRVTKTVITNRPYRSVPEWLEAESDEVADYDPEYELD